MNDFQALIPFTTHTLDHETQETVNARDLHANLEIKKDFTSWAKAQIKSLGFIQDVDFIKFTQKGELGPRDTSEYFFTLRMAEHVALASRTAKGREIRDYFIAAEKALREGSVSRGDILVEMAEAYRRQERKIATMEQAQREQTQQLIATQKQALNAYELGQKALQAQLWMTLRQYRFVNDLGDKLSDKDLTAFSRFLTAYCSEFNIPISAEPIGDRHWGKENRYHVPTIDLLLGPWMLRQYSQVPMTDGPQELV